jgi:hypothetical protein
MRELTERVASDLRRDILQLEDDSRREDVPMSEAEELRGLAKVAKRAATKLIYAAWAAEAHATAVEEGGS